MTGLPPTRTYVPVGPTVLWAPALPARNATRFELLIQQPAPPAQGRRTKLQQVGEVVWWGNSLRFAPTGLVSRCFSSSFAGSCVCFFLVIDGGGMTWGIFGKHVKRAFPTMGRGRSFALSKRSFKVNFGRSDVFVSLGESGPISGRFRPINHVWLMWGGSM